MATNKSIVDLANAVAENTAKYHAYLSKQGLPLPSHDPAPAPGPPPELPEDIVAARDTAINASYELHELLIGPYGLLLNSLFHSSRILSLSFVHANKIAQSFESNETKTFEEIAAQRNLDEDDTRRMLRLAMTNHIFAEPKPGVVAHTAASQALALNPLLYAWAGFTVQEIWPGFLKMTDAIAKWPGSQEPVETAYALAMGFKNPPFVEWEKDAPRAKQFGDAMRFLAANNSAENVLMHYDFDSKDSVQLVDIGGSHGDVAIQLAEKHPKLSCIVQDLPTVVANMDGHIPEHLRSRVKYQVHDFWSEQPVKGADIYFFREIFHDWSDPYAIKILRQLIPALRPGSRVMIVDACIPPKGVISNEQEKALRTVDLLMKTMTNAKEREGGDWAALFAKTDPGFKFLGITPPPPGARDAIIEAEWVG